MNRKQITTRILPGLLLIIACVWLLCKISFPQNISQQIRAEVYADGACIGTETITIDGSKTGGLFTGKQEFYGRMHIPSAAQTASETLKMQIFWDKELGYQRIICIPQPGTVTNAVSVLRKNSSRLKTNSAATTDQTNKSRPVFVFLPSRKERKAAAMGRNTIA